MPQGDQHIDKLSRRVRRLRAQQADAQANGRQSSCSASVNPAIDGVDHVGQRPCHAVQWVGLTITSA